MTEPRPQGTSWQVPILVETDHYAVVAKPGRLACHASAMCNDRITLIQWAKRHWGPSVHLVHRLDRATSGCLLLAFSKDATRELQAAMSAEDSRKTYWAFVRGYFKHDAPVTVDKPMKNTEGRVQEARSHVRCLGRSHEPRCSLLEVHPETGRYHQVRRHVRDLHHPVIRDPQHGDSKVNVYWRDEHAMPRLGLHCASLDLALPGGERLRVDCPPPRDLVAVWERLPWWEDAQAAAPALTVPALDLVSPNPV